VTSIRQIALAASFAHLLPSQLPSMFAHAQPTRAMQSFQPHRPCLHFLGLLGARVLQAERSPTLSMRSTQRCAHGSVQGCTHGKRASLTDFPTRYVRVSTESVRGLILLQDVVLAQAPMDTLEGAELDEVRAAPS
jgi:hypothetical protein